MLVGVGVLGLGGRTSSSISTTEEGKTYVSSTAEAAAGGAVVILVQSIPLVSNGKSVWSSSTVGLELHHVLRLSRLRPNIGYTAPSIQFAMRCLMKPVLDVSKRSTTEPSHLDYILVNLPDEPLIVRARWILHRPILCISHFEPLRRLKP